MMSAGFVITKRGFVSRKAHFDKAVVHIGNMRVGVAACGACVKIDKRRVFAVAVNLGSVIILYVSLAREGIRIVVLSAFYHFNLFTLPGCAVGKSNNRPFDFVTVLEIQRMEVSFVL